MTQFVRNKSTINDYNVELSEFSDEGNTILKTKIIDESTFDSNKPMLYDLYGVVNHYGSMNFGHYTAYCKQMEHDEGKWYCFDDSSVEPIEENKVVTDAAYVLFYKRKHC